MEGEDVRNRQICSLYCRYTSLVRRNFLRFGKRGDPSLVQEEGEERRARMEEDRQMHDFLTSYNQVTLTCLLVDIDHT